MLNLASMSWCHHVHKVHDLVDIGVLASKALVVVVKINNAKPQQNKTKQHKYSLFFSYAVITNC